MKEIDNSQKIKALLLIALSLGGVYFYYTSNNEEITEEINLEQETITSGKTQDSTQSTTETQLNVPNETQETKEMSETTLTVDQNSAQPTTSPKIVLEDFKKLVELDFTAPAGEDFYNLELDQVEAIASHNENEGLAIVAAPFKATVDQAIKFIKEDRADFKFLKTQDFNSKGDLTNISSPANSGISRITLVSGGKSDGRTTYAAVAERADGRGTYLFILKTSSSFESIGPQINEVLGSLKTRK